jgi:hypothetical protein
MPVTEHAGGEWLESEKRYGEVVPLGIVAFD